MGKIGSSKGSRSFRSHKPDDPGGKKYKFTSNSKIGDLKIDAQYKKKRLDQTIPRKDRDFDIDLGMGFAPPNEAMPDFGPGDNDDWMDDEDIPLGDQDPEDETFEYFFKQPKGQGLGRHRRRNPNEYRNRLEAERVAWAGQEEELARVYMEWVVGGAFAETEGEQNDWFDCNVISMEASTVSRLYYPKGDYASIALVRAGYIPSAPLAPTTAFTIRFLELYRILNKNHRRLGLQPFMRAIREYQGATMLNCSAHAFSKAYDCYLNILRLTQRRVDWALGRNGPNARVLRACPACLYELEGEEELTYKLLCSCDGNFSLRRFKKAGTSSNVTFRSDYFITKDIVERFADVVQVRGKGSKSKKKKKNADEDADVDADGDAQDAGIELDEGIRPDLNGEGGAQPLDVDPLGDTFEGLVSDCTEKWKANADDNKKVMWDCFDECGIFVTVCRHGNLLLACDIVQSGELSKYPLALLNELQTIFPGTKLVAYDIGCSFKSTARKGIPTLSAQFIVPAMHGWAHNRMCQLDHHPRYFPGAGLEDFETCERLFSLSNHCASITRYATAFHRLQVLHTHFTDNDASKQLALGKFIYNNYVDALNRISKLSETFIQLGLTESVMSGLYASYLAEEKRHLASLSSEPVEDQARFKYVEALEALTVKRERWEKTAREIGLRPYRGTSLEAPLPPPVAQALREYNEAEAVTAHLEQVLKIARRWGRDSEEFKEASKWALERKYRLALDRLERLVIQRLFELQKANLVNTGYKMRVQIAKHLKSRSQTIRTAVLAYNKAAVALRPAKDTIKYADVIDMAFLSQFDLLRHSRVNVSGEPWADPATRVLMDKYFELLRAKEEVARLNIEWNRVRIWLRDERALYLATIQALSAAEETTLSGIVARRWGDVQKIHRVIEHWLNKTQSLPRFSGRISSTRAKRPEGINPELAEKARIAAEASASTNNHRAPTGGTSEVDSGAVDEDSDSGYNESDVDGYINEMDELSTMVDALGSFCD